MNRIINPRKKRHLKIRTRIKGSKNHPRLSVFRSLKHIYAQIIDDQQETTMVAASDLELKSPAKKVETGGKEELKGKQATAYRVGELLAQKAKKKKIDKVSFDRGGYKYHGRIKALAQGARDGGLKF